MRSKISFSRREETLAAKARWFQQKSIGERLAAALEWMDFLKLISPKKVLNENAHKTFGSFRVLEPRRR